jgi:hypothetical protein
MKFKDINARMDEGTVNRTVARDRFHETPFSAEEF